MSRRGFACTVVALAACLGSHSLASAADAQPAIPRIGVLTPPVANSSLEEGLRDGLRELGYIEGKNILIEWRSVETDDELSSVVTGLAHLKVDLIVAVRSPAARAALSATALPVVFLVGDPVGGGFAASLARPGGNGTGVSLLTTELSAKRLEFLRLVVPRARRIAYLVNPDNPLYAQDLEVVQMAASTLDVQVMRLDARNGHEVDAALHTMLHATPEAFLTGPDVLFLAYKDKIADAVRKARIPAMFAWGEYHDAGVLMSYGPNLEKAMRVVASYVDKILKGAKPSQLPIEQASKYELIIDLRVAHAMGIQVPKELLLRADEVIR